MASQEKEKISHVINSKDHLGLTPLHYACSLGHVETVKTLLSLGADPTITNAAGQTPLFSCVRIPSLCEETLITNKTAIGLILIDQMTISDLALVDDSGNTALHEVVVHNLPSLVAKLIEKNPQLEKFWEIINSGKNTVILRDVQKIIDEENIKLITSTINMMRSEQIISEKSISRVDGINKSGFFYSTDNASIEPHGANRMIMSTRASAI